jgi:predicted HTH domain antitoxin
MTQPGVTYPEGLETAVQLTPAEMEAQIHLMAALKMFELGKLATGKAAELAGLSKGEFLEACGRYQVSIFNYAPAEVAEELQSDLNTMQQVQP